MLSPPVSCPRSIDWSPAHYFFSILCWGDSSPLALAPQASSPSTSPSTTLASFDPAGPLGAEPPFVSVESAAPVGPVAVVDLVAVGPTQPLTRRCLCEEQVSSAPAVPLTVLSRSEGAGNTCPTRWTLSDGAKPWRRLQGPWCNCSAARVRKDTSLCLHCCSFTRVWGKGVGRGRALRRHGARRTAGVDSPSARPSARSSCHRSHTGRV